MNKRTKITLVAVIVAVIISVAMFATVRHNYPVNGAMGGEGMLLLLPVITYFACKNITFTLDSISKPKEENLEEYESQVITAPKKISGVTPSLKIVVDNTIKNKIL